MKKLIIASTSTTFGSTYLDYILNDLEKFFNNTSEVLFIPYARPDGISHEKYTEKANQAFAKIGITLKGIHEFGSPVDAINNAKGIFTGGGNTFVLQNNLYKQNLIEPLRNCINKGVPYLGTSAGSNICGLTINTTNDMPIVYPPSFKSLGVVPFNINPHYLDPIPDSEHMGETRETRISEFHQFNPQPVIGLREGSWLRVENKSIFLEGKLNARIFEKGKTPYEVDTGTDLKDLK